VSFLDDYEPVENRIRAFWEDHPDGRIVTEVVHAVDGDYIFKALVYRTSNDVEPASTGFAHDSAAQLPANMKASALEVCETSAIGRALAQLGYAPKGQRPSREEMHKASASRKAAESPAPPARPVGDTSAETGTETGGPGTDSHGASEPALAAGDEPSGGGDARQGTVHSGEGVAATEGRTSSPDPLAELLEAVGGSEVKAVNAINKATGGRWRKSDLESLSPDEYAAGLAAATMGGTA
jgi:hypothetical protein